MRELIGLVANVITILTAITAGGVLTTVMISVELPDVIERRLVAPIIKSETFKETIKETTIVVVKSQGVKETIKETTRNVCEETLSQDTLRETLISLLESEEVKKELKGQAQEVIKGAEINCEPAAVSYRRKCVITF